MIVAMKPVLMPIVATCSLLDQLQTHYAVLLRHLSGRLKRFGGQADLAEDALQALSLELLESPPGTAIHTPLAFLRRAGERRVIDLLRQQGRRAQWQLSLTDAQADDDGVSDPARIVCGRQQLQLLVAAIAALPTRRREVFVLHKIHLYSQAEVASHLAISLKTVEKHLHLGVAQCRAALQQQIYPVPCDD